MGPVAFRKACRAYAQKYVDIQRAEFQRLGVIGDWAHPYMTMAPEYQATIVRELATFAERGLVYKAKKSVHWCISCRTALAEAEVEYDEGHVSPSIDVRYPLRAEEAARLGLPTTGRVDAVIWTTTPWTLPASLALAFHPDADYGVYAIEGIARLPAAREGARREGAGALEREGRQRHAARARSCPSTRAPRSSAPASRIPISTASCPACSATTSRSTPARASCTRRPATAGTTT